MKYLITGFIIGLSIGVIHDALSDTDSLPNIITVIGVDFDITQQGLKLKKIIVLGNDIKLKKYKRCSIIIIDRLDIKQPNFFRLI